MQEITQLPEWFDGKKVNEILREQMRETVELIKTNKTRIDRMVDALMKRNKLTGKEIEKLLR